MGKFGINDILNAKTKQGAAGRTGYKEIYLSPYEVKGAKENTHTKLEGIEELADSFLIIGQEQPTVLAKVNGEYRIIDGHRRNAANIYNLERGYKEYEKVLYRWQEMTEAMYELALLAGNAYTQELTAYEKVRTAERMKAALIRAKEEDGLKIQGKMRDMIADMLGESSTNIARMESISNNATDEIKEQLHNGNIGVTAAYEAAKLPEEDQRELAERMAAGEKIRAKEIAEMVAEKKGGGEVVEGLDMNAPEERRPGDDYETPHPESITSLCYSCQNYKECNVKTGTCRACDQYKNKAEAEKTEEQRYEEEQDKIDQETRRKLREQKEKEKLESLPSDQEDNSQKVHSVRLATMYFDDVARGKKTFELRKNDRGYRVGDALDLMEFDEGRYTGRTIRADITYMLEEYTGLEEGYCILGIQAIKTFGIIGIDMGRVSETDTK